jgi:DNA-binding NtrC family response regulator
LSFLREYEFPGNVRELANTLERAVILSMRSQVDVEDLPTSISAAVRSQRSQAKSLAEVEAEHIDQVLALTKGNKTQAAEILGISRKNLYERLARQKGGTKNEG